MGEDKKRKLNLVLANSQKPIFEAITGLDFMDSKLIVKNFGPIKDVEVNLKNVNVFIGQQASGKSALAKIYTIFKAPRKYFFKDVEEGNEITIDLDNEKAVEDFRDVFKEYNIDSFLQSDTEIQFESELHNLLYKNLKLEYTPKLLETISFFEKLGSNFDLNKKKIIEEINNLSNRFIYFKIRVTRTLEPEKEWKEIEFTEVLNNLSENSFYEAIDIIKYIENDLSTNAASYIPAERNFTNIIKKSSLNLIINNVPIPKHILKFGAELEKQNIQEINLDFIQPGLKYKNVDGEDLIFIDDAHSIKLSESSSGIQSVVPILSTIFDRVRSSHRSFVIEEPELNLFPSTQYELIQFLESNRDESYWQDSGTIHTYTTHSPFVLSALNNLLYAHKVYLKMLDFENLNDYFKQSLEFEKKLKQIVKVILAPRSFAAYQLSNGYAVSIFNEETGLIDDNFIDETSDKINDDFEKLMTLLDNESTDKPF